MKILIDNGHGKDTPGKRSPDGRLREYAWAREIAQRIVDTLKSKGYDAERIVTEDTDVALATRCKRVNAICGKVGAKNALLVSIHVNARGNGSWQAVPVASGWQVHVSHNASNNSKKLAQSLYAQASALGLQGNRAVPSGHYWVDNFYILRATNCPAVLSENLFQDNREEVDYLLSVEGKQAIVNLHVNGIIDYIKSL